MHCPYASHILVFEPGSCSNRIVCDCLSAAFADSLVTSFTDPNVLIHNTIGCHFDVAVVDQSLVQCSESNTIQTIRERWPECLIITLVEADQEAAALEALGVEFDYYVMRSADLPDRIVSAVKALLGISRRLESSHTFQGGSCTLPISAGRCKRWISCYGTQDTEPSTLVTESGQMKCVSDILLDIIDISNRSATVVMAARELTAYLKRLYSCHSVGVRIREGDDYTYCATTGFSEEFIRKEKSLCVFNECGELVFNGDGVPMLDCMCGRIISRRFDPSKSYFTDNGSFWTNSTSELGARCDEDDECLKNGRGRCAEEYESVALIPLIAGTNCLGLLQLNDQRKGLFEPASIKLLEEIAFVIAHVLNSKQSEEQTWITQRTMDKAADPIYWVDSTGQIVYANEAAARLTGYTREELCAMTASELNPNYPPRRWAEYWTNLRNKRSVTMETSHRAKNGTIIPIEMNTHYVEMDNGELSFAFARDISRRMRAINALHESNQLLEAVIDASPLAIILLDVEGRVTKWNPAAERIFGWSKEEVVGKKNPTVVAGATEKDFIERYPAILSGQQFASLERVRKRKDGSSVYVSISTAALIDDAGKPTGALAIMEDITERRQAQARIDDLLNDLETFFNLVPDLVCIASTNGYFKRLNSAWQKVLGYTRKELLNRPYMEFIHPDDVESTLREADRQLAGESTLSFVNRYRCKDGSYRWLEWQASPAKKGKLLYAAARDITERKRADEAIAASRNHLHALSRELVNVQEAERRRIARELHDQIGGSVTALSIALGMGISSEGERSRESLRRAQSVADELEKHIRDLALDLRPASLDDFGLVPALLRMFDRYSDRTRIQVHFRHHDMQQRFNPEVETAAFRIVQEALNNIARHSGMSEAKVRLWADASELYVVIADSGTGFDPEAVMEASMSSGLSIMKERASLLGGALTVESKPGSGTQISAIFPLECDPK